MHILHTGKKTTRLILHLVVIGIGRCFEVCGGGGGGAMNTTEHESFLHN